MAASLDSRPGFFFASAFSTLRGYCGHHCCSKKASKSKGGITLHAETRFTHTGTARDDGQLAAMEALSATVDVGKAEGHAGCFAAALHNGRKVFERVAPRISDADLAKRVR